jgi:hypothetical protein
MNIRKIDLRRLNSLTKYPSILTYHGLGEKGRLTDEILVSFDGESEVIVTEKVDGTNTRIILLSDKGFIIGSREELLYYHGDLLFNPALGIVEALRPTFGEWAALANHRQDEDALSVYFGEVYGGNIGGGAKNYTSEGRTGFRLFDVMSVDNLTERLAQTLEQIAHWRDNGGQKFCDEQTFRFVARDFKPSTPRLKVTSPPPTAVADVYEWLKEVCSRSQCALDGKALARPEGVVVRTPDRSKIAKIRFEDYERTLRVKKS